MFASVSMSATTLFAVILFTSAAVVFDLRSRRIPNWLTVSSGALGLVYHLATGGISGLGFGLGGFVVGFGVLLVLWLVGGGGGGDVKLMGAVGAWLGPVPTIMIFIGSVAFAILCTGAKIVWESIGPRRRRANESLLKQTIPYALPVSLAIWTLFVVQVAQDWRLTS